MEAAGAADADAEIRYRGGKRMRKRTEAEKEERRRRKEAEAAAAAAGSGGASTPQDGPQVLQVGSRPTSAVSTAPEDVPHRAPKDNTSNFVTASQQVATPPGQGGGSAGTRGNATAASIPVPSTAWGGNSAAFDLERGEGRGGGGGSGGGGGGGGGGAPVTAPNGGDAPRFIPPSYAVALKHAKRVNVYRQRAGITVRMNHDALVGLSGDEILADIYGECERRGILIHRVVKDGKASAAIEDVPTSQAADLALTGVTIRGVRVRCVPEESLPASSGGGGDGDGGLPDLSQRYVFSKTGPEELGELGVGIGLYFESLLWGAKVLGSMTFLGFFTVIVYLRAGTLDTQLEAGALTGLSIPTLGAVSWAKEQGFRLLWFRDNSVWGGSDEGVMMAVACIECTLAVVFIWAVQWLTAQQRETIQSIDVSNITLTDYSLKIDGLPKRGMTPEEIGQFFAKFGRVHMVVLGTNVGGIIGQHRNRAKWLRNREVMDAALAKSGGKSGSLRRAMMSQAQRFEKLEAMLKQKSSSSASLFTSAFVTFETEVAKDKALRAYKPHNLLAWMIRPERLMMRGTHRLWVRRAPEASDILWENLGVVGLNAWCRRLIAWFGMLIVLVCTGAAVVVAQSSANKIPPTISCQPVEDAGTLTCDAMWPAAAASGAASKAILNDLGAFVSQVDAEVCRAYVVSGSWKGNSSVYAPYVRPSAGLYDNATGAWTGGFDATTVEDECSALACFDCMCKTKFVDSFFIAVGISSDADGWWHLCQDYFISKSLEVATAAFTTFTNVLLAAMTRSFSTFERHHTKSALEASVSVKLFLALTINSAVIPLLVYANVEALNWIPYLFTGPYRDFSVGWYQNVASLVSVTMAVNAIIYPLTALVKNQVKALYRAVFSGYALTQRGLNEMYEGSEFRLSERYAQMTSMIFTAIMFSAGMPLLVPLAALFCLMVYNEGKLTLLRHSKKPPEYDEAMAEIFVSVAPWASVMKIPIAGWMLSYVSVPTYTYSVSVLDDALKPADLGSQFDLNDRLDRSNAAASVVTLALLLIAYVIRANQLAIKGFIKRILPDIRVFDDEEFSLTPDLSIARSDGILKGLKTYMVKDNPDYAGVVPSTATLVAGGVDAPIPPGWEGVHDEEDRGAGSEAGGGGGDGAANSPVQEAGSLPAGMARMIAARESQSGGDGDAGGEESVARRKPTIVTGLMSPSFEGQQVTDFGDDFYEPEVEGTDYDAQNADGLAAAMAMQPEGSQAPARGSDGGDDVDKGLRPEEAEERRGRKREKKERRKKRDANAEL